MSRYIPIIATALSVAFTSQAAAFPACPTQQQLEQVRGSDGKYIPDDCRELSIVRVTAGGKELCVLDFENRGDPTFLDRLRNAAVSTKWWVACENLSKR
jgi:hypothetical protein